ncbi:SDR family NAD(P)-dependent oxidoreductase [Streptomyces sp. AK02-01A]|uniref:SDR family NAD(P)-dependent oxidoreductase n=1 Tax=Streptomyces sp. AK02-01A TaxID=3028648 RepID=UPI0029C9B401|nr:SDR family NAD(P)-dependent oxidoreductase [Streptomyces sp. AK02-01A]
MSTNEKVWFITGTSRGFGREWAEAALERGDKVAATARDTGSLQPLTDRYGDLVLLPLELDVTNKPAVDSAVARAHEHFGGLDVVVNNAGYGLFGTVEEISETEARAQIETNLFGALWVTKAALPIFRAQGSGHFLQVSSIGGVMAFANLSMYHVSKWGLEAFSQSLAQEMEPFGVHVTVVEPTNYGTDWSGSSAVHATPIDVYEPARAARAARIKPGMVGDPAATRGPILEIVDSERPPLRFLLGRGQVDRIAAEYEQRMKSGAPGRSSPSRPMATRGSNRRTSVATSAALLMAAPAPPGFSRGVFRSVGRWCQSAGGVGQQVVSGTADALDEVLPGAGEPLFHLERGAAEFGR